MILTWLKVLRPLHWVKNLFVLAPLLFARHLFDLGVLYFALAAFVCFCLMSSCVYLINDVFDARPDRLHPLKARRPVAAGVIHPSSALGVASFLGGAALAGSLFLDVRFGLVGAAYLVINLLYSRWVKRVAFLDVVSIASGFVLRVVGGAIVINVEISGWLVICTFFLACLLGFGKRRHELAGLDGFDSPVRPALANYSAGALRSAEWIAASVTLTSYICYTVAPGTIAKFHTYGLLYTLPFPVIGILRYLHLVESKHSLSPTEALVTDVPSILNLIGWVAMIVLVLYEVG